MTLDDRDRKGIFVRLMEGRPRTRANLVEAFFRASAEAWKDARRSGRENVYVGYSPIIGVDADKIIADYENSHVLNVVRNPWSAYADTRKRAVPLSIAHYMTGWSVHQQHALAFAARFPGRVHILRYEDIVADPVRTLSDVLAKMGVSSSPTLASPSWNGKMMDQVHPWGTIRTPTPEANQAAAKEHSAADTEEIRLRAEPFLQPFGYDRP
jgi:hypothetical protein